MSYQYSSSKESDASATPLTTSGQRRPRKVHATTFTPEVAVRRPTTSDAAAAGVTSTPTRADTSDAVMASVTQRLASTSPPCKAVDDVSVTKMEITTDCSETGTNGVDTGNKKDLKPEDMDCGDAVTATVTVTSTCEDTARTCPVQQSKSIESESSDINVSEVDDDSHSIVVDQPEDSVLDLSFSVKDKRQDVNPDAAVTSHVKLAVTERDKHKDKAHSSNLTTAAAAAGNSVHENGGSRADSSSGTVISPTRNAPIDRTLSSAGSGSSSSGSRSSAASSHAKPPSHRPDTGRSSVDRAAAGVESRSMTSRDSLETASAYPFSLDPYSLASSSYMSFDPRILQFYSDDERRKWALSGFMPALYAQPPPSPRDSLLAAAAAAAGEHSALQSMSRLANPAAAALFADHVTSHGAQLSDRQFSAAAFLPKHESSSSSSSSAAASQQSKAASKSSSEKTARKLSLTDRPVGDKPEVKCFPRNLNTATSQAAKLKTEPGKKAKAVTDRETSRNRATPPAVTAASAQQSSGACVC